MWKKTEPETPQTEFAKPKASVNPLKERATVGSSILVKGDLSGEEDLLIQGRVEGRIDLKNYNLTVGQQGRVKADVYAKIISVEGQVEGNLFGEEKVIIRKSGNVKGNLAAPRVSLEEGASFKGSIDMDSRTVESAARAVRSAPAKPAVEPETPKPASSPQKVPLALGSDPAPTRSQ